MITFGVELEDKVSAPANAAAVAMGTASERARDLHGRFVALHDAAGGASGGIHQLHEHTSGLHEAWEVFEGSLAARVVERAFDAIVESGRELVMTVVEASERVTHLTEVFGALSGAGEGAGEEMGKAIFAMTRQLATQLPQSEAQIQSWTRSLMGAGVTDMGKLQASLRAIAGAEALVEGGGERIRGILGKLNEASMAGTKIKFSIASLSGTGVTEEELMRQMGMTPRTFELAKKNGTLTGTAIADALTRALGEKAAGPLAGQMGELTTIMTKGKDLAMRLLEGVDPKPLIEGMRELFSIFDSAEPSGQVIKSAIGGAFDFVFRSVGKVFATGKDLFLHVIIWSLEAAIALKHFSQWWQDMPARIARLSPYIAGVAATILTLFVPSMYAAAAATIAWAITALPAAIAGAIAYAGAMWTAAIATLAVTWPLLAIAAAVGLAVFAIVELVKHWDVVKAFLLNMATKAWEAAKGFVQGFVDGITNGVGLVVDAVKNMGHAAWNALKGVLGIHSPSTVMLQAGLQTSQGFAQGLTAGTGQVEGASADVATAAIPGARGGSAGEVSNTFHIDVHIEAGHAATPHELRGIVEEEFAALANRLSSMMGSAPVPA